MTFTADKTHFGGSATARKKKPLIVFCALALAAAAALAFSPTLDNGFNSWDDQIYVTANPLARSLSPPNLKAIFSTYVSGNYHPLPILSYALEHRFFGQAPRPYHATNLLLHVLNSLLVLWLLHRLCGSLPVALIAAGLWALHPMRVEPVAWITGRKDLLCALFGLASLIGYCAWTQNRRSLSYGLSLVFFILSLLSKATVLMLPPALLLIDFYRHRKINRAALVEKIPFFLAASIFGIIALAARSSYETTLHEDAVPQLYAILLGLYRLAGYFLLRTAVPGAPGVLHPYPGQEFGMLPPAALLVCALLAGAALAVLVFFSLRFTRKIFFGSLFFFALIFPVLTVVNLGHSADRFSYLPSIGLFYLAAEASLWVYKKSRQPAWRAGMGAGLLVLLIFMGTASGRRCAVWRDSISLWSDAIQQFPEIPAHYHNRASAHLRAGRPGEAADDYTRALELAPRYANAYCGRALAWVALKNPARALADYALALKHDPRMAYAHYCRGDLYLSAGDLQRALADYSRAIALSPGYTEAYQNRAIIYATLGDYDRAWQDVTRLRNLKWPINPKFLKSLRHYSGRNE